VFMIVLVGSYISIGALAHDLGFSATWTVLSTLLVWAAPAQVILITAIGAGTAPIAAGIAVAIIAVVAGLGTQLNTTFFRCAKVKLK